MIWPAVVEEWPTEVCLYVPDLPGFISKADSGAGTLAQANDTLDGWIDWLVRSELVEQRPETGAINIVETLAATEGRGPPLCSRPGAVRCGADGIGAGSRSVNPFRLAVPVR